MRNKGTERFLATDAAVTRVVTGMPEWLFQILVDRVTSSGETLRERIGRVAYEADRLQDVASMEVIG